MTIAKYIAVVAGCGPGIGAATCIEFAKLPSYAVAMVGRDTDFMGTVSKQINTEGGNSRVFSLKEYTAEECARVFNDIHKAFPDAIIKAGIWNAARWSRIPWEEAKPTDIELSVRINIVSAFNYSKEVSKHIVKHGQYGSLLFTGATSSTRGRDEFSVFAAGKSGLRAMTQSLAREMGPRGLHVAHVIVDGAVDTPRMRKWFKSQGLEGLDDHTRTLKPSSIAKAYVYLHSQDPSAWTLEMDLRPSKEKF